MKRKSVARSTGNSVAMRNMPKKIKKMTLLAVIGAGATWAIRVVGGGDVLHAIIGNTESVKFGDEKMNTGNSLINSLRKNNAGIDFQKSKQGRI